MPNSGVERRLTAILAADVVGYSRLMEVDEEGTVRSLSTHRETIDSLIVDHHGRVFGSAGDSVVAEFPSPVEAVRCAVTIQQELGTHNADLPADQRMQLRIGINLGDVIVEGNNLLGDGVNIAARLESIADPGGITLSRSVYDQVKKQLVFDYQDMGEQRLKNIADVVQVYKVAPADTQETQTAIEAVNSQPEYPDKPSIAVLPFTNMSGDPEQEFFSDGITSDIVSTLSHFRNIHVVAFHSTYVYKNRKAPISVISQEMGVRYILEGRIRKSGNRIRINAELIDAKPETLIWSETFDRELDDIFAVQDEITMSIVTAMKVHLTDGERARDFARDTENLKAWECCIRAGDLSDSYITSNILEARRLIAIALAADPNYSTAWATLGWINWQEAYIGSEGAMGKLLNSARDAAEKSLEIDPETHRALTLQAFTHQLQGDDPELALNKMDQALSIAPGNAEVLGLSAYTYFYAHKLTEAMGLFRSAIRLSPVCPSWMYLIGAGIYQRQGELEKAIGLYLQSVDAEPDSPLAYYFLIDAYMESGNMDNANDVAGKIRSLENSININSCILAHSHDEVERDRLRSNLAKMGFS